jgi:predicted aspartyl protease
MPTIHSQVAGQAKGKNGTTIVMPPMAALQQRGPVVQVLVTIEQNAGKALASQGKPVPIPEPGIALIDTGASNSCIDEKVAQKLGLPVIDQGSMLSASHEKVPCNIYPALIATPIMNFNIPRAMGASLAPHGLIAIIGRDVLQACVFFYNGLSGEFTLSV